MLLIWSILLVLRAGNVSLILKTSDIFADGFIVCVKIVDDELNFYFRFLFYFLFFFSFLFFFYF